MNTAQLLSFIGLCSKENACLVGIENVFSSSWRRSQTQALLASYKRTAGAVVSMDAASPLIFLKVIVLCKLLNLSSQTSEAPNRV